MEKISWNYSNEELTRLLTVESRLEKHHGFCTRRLEDSLVRGFYTKLEFFFKSGLKKGDLELIPEAVILRTCFTWS